LGYFFKKIEAVEMEEISIKLKNTAAPSAIAVLQLLYYWSKFYIRMKQGRMSQKPI
jgi:hypothetical protein